MKKDSRRISSSLWDAVFPGAARMSIAPTAIIENHVAVFMNIIISLLEIVDVDGQQLIMNGLKIKCLII
jgi:hypothetical protein